jgi:hypothetical protein
VITHTIGGTRDIVGIDNTTDHPWPPPFLLSNTTAAFMTMKSATRTQFMIIVLIYALALIPKVPNIVRALLDNPVVDDMAATLATGAPQPPSPR